MIFRMSVNFFNESGHEHSVLIKDSRGVPFRLEVEDRVYRDKISFDWYDEYCSVSVENKCNELSEPKLHLKIVY